MGSPNKRPFVHDHDGAPPGSRPAQANDKVIRSFTSQYPSDTLSSSDSANTSTPSKSSTAPSSAQSSFTAPSGSQGDNPFVSYTEHIHVKKFPQHGLFADALPCNFERSSPRVRYEATRLANSLQIPVGELSQFDAATWESYDTLWNDFRSLIKADRRMPPKCSQDAWSAADEAAKNNSDVHRGGCLKFDKASAKTMFQLELQPLQKDRSNRLFRKFGAHRFLTIALPSFAKDLPVHMSVQREHLRRRFQEWLSSSSMTLMGYQWVAFYAKVDGSSRKGRHAQDNKSKGYEVVLFATHGSGLHHISADEFLNWFIPLDLNPTLPFCKAFARIELGLSRTIPTYRFRPNQVREVPDILADGLQIVDPFLDPKLQSEVVHNTQKPAVMNDGCSRISWGAAKKIWLMLRGSGPCPSVFQARIGPWKGVWMISAAQNLEERDEIWIEVSESQKKFTRHLEDLDEAHYDPERLTFEVITWSQKPKVSSLYLDHLPVLEDRGVPRSRVSELVKKVLDNEKDALIEAMESSQSLYKWIQEKFPSHPEAHNRELLYSGAMAPTLSEKVKELLSAGFDLPTCQHLADLLKNLVSRYFWTISTELRIPISRSTHVFGVADPQHCLAPHEIHLAFSSSFGEEQYPFLDDVDVLVARHPSLRRSDMQKVKAVYKRELRHLQDVVVFPVSGVVPLASKLQGGDYDGDTFFVSWEPNIVEDFKNAPCPVQAKPGELGIKVDQENILEMQGYGSENFTKSFLARSFAFACEEKMLGIVTNHCYDLIYDLNSLDSVVIDKYLDLHDYLIDSAKNGYSFRDRDWIAFKRMNPGSSEPLKPSPQRRAKSNGSIPEPKPPYYNIADWLRLKVAKERTKEITCEIDVVFSVSRGLDSSLTRLYHDYRKNLDKSVKSSMVFLRDKVVEIWKKHSNERGRIKHAENTGRVDSSQASKDYREADRKAVEEYLATWPPKPDFDNSEEVRGWLQRPLPNLPKTWDLIKASALYAILSDRPEFAFLLARSTLCFMKAYSTERPHVIVGSIHSRLKIRKALQHPKLSLGLRAEGQGLEENVNFEGEEEEVYFDVWDGDTTYLENFSTEEEVFHEALEELTVENHTAENQGFEDLSQDMEKYTFESPRKKRRSTPKKGDTRLSDEFESSFISIGCMEDVQFEVAEGRGRRGSGMDAEA